MMSIIVFAMIMAHMQYPVACCDNKDCGEIEDGKVMDMPDGYLFPNGQTVPHNLTMKSHNERYHWCLIPGTNIIRQVDGKYCVFIPFGGV